VDQRQKQNRATRQDWTSNPRWQGVMRGYSAKDVVRLRGSVQSSTHWRSAAPKKLWRMAQERRS